MSPRRSSPKPAHDVSSNLVHFYVLHRACYKPTFGLQIIEELGRLGYKVSPGTVYPLLEGLEERGILRSRQVRRGRTARKLYRATAAGRDVYTNAKEHIDKLLDAMWGKAAKKASKLY